MFRSSCTILHSHQNRMRVPFAPHPCQHLMLSVVWILAILTSVALLFKFASSRWQKMWRFFSHVYLSYVYRMRCPFRSLAPFLIGLFLFSLLTFKSSLYSFIRYVFCKHFLPVYGWSSHFLVFGKARIFNFNEVQLIKSFFCELCPWCYKKVTGIPMVI